MILDFDYLGTPKTHLLIYDIIPSPKVGILLLIVSLILIIFYGFQRNQQPFTFLNRLTLLIASIALVGTFIYSSRYTDEPFVNLEHTYNLLHHGLFSFSPSGMVDGTVEYSYYLLLTPFAFDRTALVQGSLIVGASICWLHLFILWKLLSGINLELKLFFLLWFAVSVPFVEVFSSGFGNGLVSLIFFGSLYFQIQGKINRSLSLAAILPLIRPDAILYSLSLFLVDFIQKRKIRWLYWSVTGGCVAIYLGFIRLFYGHWIPVPVAFKSDALSNLSATQILRSLFLDLFNYFSNPFHFFPLLLLIPFVIFSKIFAQVSQKIKNLYYLWIPLSAIFLFYNLTMKVPEQRYFIGFELFLTVLPFLTIQGFVGNKEIALTATDEAHQISPNLLLVRSRRALTLLLFCLSLLIALMSNSDRLYGLAFGTNNKSLNSAQVSRITALGVGGQMIDEIIPKNWSIAATELHTFGFMNDRDIIDLWGYTNPVIAHSKICSKSGNRNKPEFFLQVKPDVAWIRTDRANGVERSGFPHLSTDLETVLATWDNFNKNRNLYGNMVEVMKQYDLVFLRDKRWVNTLLVKKELKPQLLDLLAQKFYELTQSRPIDQEKLKRVYDSQKLMQFKC
jgi:hypothetical protein